MDKIKGIKSLFDEHQAKVNQLKALVKAGMIIAIYVYTNYNLKYSYVMIVICV